MRAKSMTLRYMGWVQRELAGGKPVWGILIAREFSDGAKFHFKERIASTLDRFAKDIRRLHTADQALYAAFDTFVRLFLTCIQDPPSVTLTAAKVQGQHRYNNYLQNVARNMNGDARAALGELTNRG